MSDSFPSALPPRDLPAENTWADPAAPALAAPADPTTDSDLSGEVPTRTQGTFSLSHALAGGFLPLTQAPLWRGLTRTQLHLGALIVSVCVAALTRLLALGGVDRIAFDETYYVKDAYALWHLGYEGRWADDVNDAFVAGDFSGLSSEGAFVVHPSVGKWLIGIGPEIFGWTNPWAWRLTGALAGVVMVALLCLIVKRLFDAPALTLMGGLFLAVDGVAVSVSRIALLDVYVATFILAGFATFLRDQADWHARLAAHLRAHRDNLGAAEAFSATRPWLVATGVLWGLALGTKWNAVYVIAAAGIYLFIREVTARFAAGMRGHTLATRAVVRGGLPAFVQLVPVALVVYLMTWTSWFLHPGAYGHGKSGVSGPLAPLADLWRYHTDTLAFHEGVTSEHRYQSNPLQWLLDLRPTSMMWVSDDSGATEMVRASTTIGNPLLWWIGVAAVVFVLLVAIWRRDWRAGFIIVGYVSLWAPWLLFWGRTIFMFYTIVFVPFVVLAVCYLIGTILGLMVPTAWPLRAWEDDLRPPQAPADGVAAGVGWTLAVLIVAVGVFFVPVTAAWEIPRDHWQWRMWLPSWV